MIVVDANLIVYRYVSGPLSSLARAALDRDADWRTASMWRCEFAGAVVNMIRAKILDQNDALEAMSNAANEMSARTSDVPQENVVRIALRDGISAYDAQYIALAELLNLKCVTADGPLARKAPHTTILLSDFARS